MNLRKSGEAASSKLIPKSSEMRTDVDDWKATNGHPQPGAGVDALLCAEEKIM
jgi:hypothetical protein